MSEKVVAPYGKLSTTAQSPPPRPALSIALATTPTKEIHTWLLSTRKFFPNLRVIIKQIEKQCRQSIVVDT